MGDGSKESLYYPIEELDPNMWKGMPLQKSFEKVDVDGDCKYLIVKGAGLGDGGSWAAGWTSVEPHLLGRSDGRVGRVMVLLVDVNFHFLFLQTKTKIQAYFFGYFHKNSIC